MNLKQKIALGIGGLALIVGSYIGGQTLCERVYARGYENGKQEVKQEVTAAGNIILENCEYDMNRLKGFMYSGPIEEQGRLQEIYRKTLEKRTDVKSLINDVLDDRIQINMR